VVVGGCATIEAGARVDTGVVVPRYATVDDDALRNDDSP
jgi:hypothetical protein